jgi:flagellar motor component MotA
MAVVMVMVAEEKKVFFKTSRSSAAAVSSATATVVVVMSAVTQAKALPKNIPKNFFLTQTEALRVIAVLERAIEKLDLLGVLSSDYSTNNPDLLSNKSSSEDKKKSNDETQSVVCSACFVAKLLATRPG